MSESDNLHLVLPVQTTSAKGRVPIGTARALKVLFGLLVLIHAIAVWSDAQQLGMLMRAQQGTLPTDAEAETNDLRQAGIGVVQTVFGLSAWITFLVWTYRANASLHRLGTEGMEFTPGWSVGWYFIPVLCLWKPCYAMCEIWRASENASSDWKGKPVSCLVGLWWAFWLISFISGQLASKLLLRAEAIDELANATYVTLFADAVDIPYYAVSLALVGAVTTMQARRSS